MLRLIACLIFVCSCFAEAPKAVETPAATDQFQVDPSYTHAVHVLKDGKKFMVTYWCDVCSIRQYEPGPCWCCQRETHLDLRPLDPEP